MLEVVGHLDTVPPLVRVGWCLLDWTRCKMLASERSGMKAVGPNVPLETILFHSRREITVWSWNSREAF